MFTCAEGLLDITSLPPQGRGKECVHSILPRPHIVGFTLGMLLSCNLCSSVVVILTRTTL